jgi:hypothetical protein
MKAMQKEVWKEGDKSYSKTGHVVEGLRLLTNASRVGRFYYESWQKELLYLFVKVPGGAGLDQSRPVGLLEILLKGTYTVDFAAITTVWEKLGLLADPQYAFRIGRGTEGAMMLWLLMGERAYQAKEDQARGQGDLEHAYDSAFQWAVELTLMRLGVGEEYVEYVAELIRTSKTAVITPFGLTEWFQRAAGLPQGGPQSCAEWNALIDVMAEMQTGLATEQGVRISDAWGGDDRALGATVCGRHAPLCCR